jgi:uncharacterized protein (DUF433 family)
LKSCYGPRSPPDLPTAWIKGTRVTVSNVVRQLAAGRSMDAIFQDYPYLCEEDVCAALAFAADMTNGDTYELLAS